jgi:transposase
MAITITEGPRRIVGGVDTHKDLHVAAVVDEQDQVIGTRSFATTRQGYRQMLAWMLSFGELQRIGVESTGSYGAGLLRFMQQANVAVLEVTTPDKQDRRRRGKNDDLDAQNAAHAAFAGQRTVTPRSRDGMIESLRILMACRKTAVSARRVALQMIHNTIICAPDGLRDQLRSLTRMQLVRTLAAWRPDLTAYRDVDSAYRIGLKSLARRYLELHDEIADLDAMIAAIVDELAPNLVARNSIGHIGAAQLLLTAGDNPERLRSEASFASLCGVSPVPASSGKTVRHRLNRGGDRAANSVTHYRHRTSTNRPPDQGLRRSTDRRRAFQTRRHSSTEAVPRKRGLYAHHSAPQRDQRHANCRLTNRRASEGRSMRPRCIASCWPPMAWRDR